MTIDPEVQARFAAVDSRLDQLDGHVHELLGQASATGQIIKFVVTPLLAIVGGLVGLKLIIP